MARTSEARGPLAGVRSLLAAASSSPLRAPLAAAAGLVIPPACLHCGNRRFGRLPLCRACFRRLEPLAGPVCDRCGDPRCRDGHAGWPHPFDAVRALHRVTPELSTLVHGFKYRHQRRNARFLAAGLRRRPDLLAWLREADALVPVPLHPTRRRERGYNQSEVIAEAFAAHCGVPARPGLLRRARRTSTQTRLGREERARNLSGAFVCPDTGAVAGRRLVLVDDVFTTGATAAACAGALKAAGCASVGVLTLGLVAAGDAPEDFVREMDLVAAYLA